MLLLNDCKSHYNGTKNKGIRSKLYWKRYFYDEIGVFHTKRISLFEVFKGKFMRKAHIKVCYYCKNKWVTYDNDRLLCDLCNSFGGHVYE